MSILPVPGTRPYYETLGRGPLLVMVPGATGTAEGLRRVAEHLARSHTVAIYDRRGFPEATSTGHRTSTGGWTPTPTTCGDWRPSSARSNPCVTYPHSYSPGTGRIAWRSTADRPRASSIASHR